MPNLTCDILTRPADLQELEPEWRRLAQKCPDSRCSAGYDWCRLHWEGLTSPDDRLRIVVLRDEAHPVLIWPFAIRRKRGVLREARPLGCLLTEYTDPLVLPAADSHTLLSRALRSLRGHTDLIHLPLVPEDSDLGRLLASGRDFTPLFTLPVSRAEFGRPADWERYRSSIARSALREMERRIRRLREEGLVQFEIQVDPSRSAEVIDWMLERKRAWLSRTGKSSPWLGTESFRRRLLASAQCGDDPSHLMISTLTLQGRLLSAKVSRRDQRRLEFLITTFDPEFGRFGPSQLLCGEILNWACAHGLDADFRLGDESYKEVWTNRRGSCTTYEGAGSIRGRLFLQLRSAAHRLQKR
ncbi:MAG: GNAT family N-acetyltransferase [Verrucomicrobiota bacterium]